MRPEVWFKLIGIAQLLIGAVIFVFIIHIIDMFGDLFQ